MSIVIAFKSKDWAVIGADRRATVTMADGDTFSTKFDKLIGIGNNTLFGFSGDTENVNDLIILLRNNSSELDRDLLGTLKKLRNEIRNIDIDIQALFCGITNNKIDMIEFIADKKNRRLSIESLHMDNDVVGETVMGLNTMNSKIIPYLEYINKTGQQITMQDAEFLVYTAVADISDSGILTVGSGIAIWEIKKDGDKASMQQVPDSKILDFFDSGYRLYRKKSTLAMDEALKMLRGLTGTSAKESAIAPNLQYKDKAK
ncbi:MAG: hypothetical protein M1360_02415 [Candidatus Marsarchaeota archaeon]|nr:hypothetical protein [Candidatus Marsarchaeota archaeon]MCL5418772.1 hypothetical protein [Candidatus Marsarchaeota archaeon]